MKKAGSSCLVKMPVSETVVNRMVCLIYTVCNESMLSHDALTEVYMTVTIPRPVRLLLNQLKC